VRPLALLGGVLALGNFGGPSRCSGQAMRTFSVTRPTGAERFLHVTLDFSGGSVLLMPALAGQLYGMRVRYDPVRYAPVQQYDPRTGILHLGLESVGGMGVRVTSRTQLEQVARFEFATNVPLALYATLGASDATIDLGGTLLTELEIRSGATHTAVDFSRPTRGTCKSATFTVGASQLDVQHLAQAGCAALRVDGGAGRATLGFRGEWRRDATLVVDLALGGLELQIPRGTGVRIMGQRFLAPLAGDGFVKAGDTWTTPGFEQAAHKLTVELKTSLVRTHVEWTDN
jgi:hypothetical protein